MSRSRTSTAWLLLWGGLLFQSLRPIAPVERALEFVLAPLRLVAELGSPLALLRARRVAAAERELARAARSEAAEGAAMLSRLAARALPSDPALLAARRFVPAEVLERPSKDECWVALRERARVERGAPVVCGDAFVGRVLELRQGVVELARVQLVTASTFRVGAEVRGDAEGSGAGGILIGGDEPVYLTAGGVRVPLSRGEPREVRIAAHQPSSSALAGGLARVHELFADADDSAGLAEGFRLGEVRAGERGVYWIEPELDYLDGLFQVAIVVRPETAATVEPAKTALEDGQWLATRALTLGDPTPWRSTLKVPLGRGAGLRPGAAVTGAGARLVGRVSRAGLTTSDVALLADPGFTLAAVALLEDDGVLESNAEPRILGRVTTLGRAPDGAIRLRWWVRVPLEVGGNEVGGNTEGGASEGEPSEGGIERADEGLRARLFSGSGDPGLPGGLYMGTALLPRSARAGEEREILLSPEVDPGDVRALFVRREAEGARP